MPVLGAASVTAKATEDALDDLPVAFDAPTQSQRSTVLDANGDVLAYFYEENRVYVELDQVAPIMRKAMVAIEDHRFYEHGPLDAQGTLRAFITNLAAGGVAQGGSTITQQYVKMVQIEEAKKKGDEAAVEAAQDGTYGRKIRELRYAITVEKTLSKDEILERYLNIAYFGDGAYGIEVAAEHYFGTTAAKLTLAQAAMLAGLVQNPTAFNPVINPTAALERRNVVLNRMAELGIVSAAQAGKAKRSRLRPRRGDDDGQWLPGHRLPVPLRLRLPVAGADPESWRGRSRNARTASNVADSPSPPRSIPTPRTPCRTR